MKIIQKTILIKDNKYLILLRSKDAKYFPQYWDCPGGTLEENEDPIDGIKREVLEETDLVIEPVKIVGKYEFDIDNKGENTHRYDLYTSNLISGNFKLSPEHTDYKWATKEEMLKLKIEPFIRSYFEEIRQQIPTVI